MTTVPITIRLATKLTLETHRREPTLTGALWAIGLRVDATIVGCAVVGFPKARLLDGPADAPKLVMEVLRVAVPEGVASGCSKLYGAAVRTAREQGARSLLTYTHADEPGTSLRAAGWLRDEDENGAPVVFGGGHWGRDERPRARRKEEGPKHRWWAPWSDYLAAQPAREESPAPPQETAWQQRQRVLTMCDHCNRPLFGGRCPTVAPPALGDDDGSTAAGAKGEP